LIGVAAAVGLVIYFLLAIAVHVRADDARNMPTPVLIELMAVAALTLGSPPCRGRPSLPGVPPG
jgi:hypothetical protein